MKVAVLIALTIVLAYASGCAGLLGREEAGERITAPLCENGTTVSNKPWIKTDGDFGAMLVFTGKPDELFASWNETRPGVHVSQTGIAVRGAPIVAVIFFSGCGADEKGRCDLVARFTTTTPAGKLWGKPVDADLWVGLPPPTGTNLQLSHGNLGIVIDPGDDLGVYTVKAEIKDRVTGKGMVLERQFTAVEAQGRAAKEAVR